MDRSCLRLLSVLGIPGAWALSMVVKIIKRKDYIRNCSYHTSVKLFEHGMNVVELVLEKTTE